MKINVLFIAIFLMSVLISSISQIMLKKSADKEYASKIKEYLNPLVFFAYVLFFVSTLVTVFAYSRLPLSLGPILESSGYVYVTVLGFLFLKERLNKKRMAGMALIILGIIVFSL